jgi:hypothetical protein
VSDAVDEHEWSHQAEIDDILVVGEDNYTGQEQSSGGWQLELQLRVWQLELQLPEPRTLMMSFGATTPHDDAAAAVEELGVLMPLVRRVA